jgi:hypothetical protein
MKGWIALLAVVIAGYFLAGAYPTSPLRGPLKSVTVTKRYFAGDSGKAEEMTVQIEDPQRVAAIEKSLRRVWNGFTPTNSGEGSPKYRMQVVYADGTTGKFTFTKTEWSATAQTPDAFVEELKANGL